MLPSRILGVTALLSRHTVVRWGVAMALIAAAGVAGATLLTQASGKGPKAPKGPKPIAAQGGGGCCFCFDCDNEAPFCSDFMSSLSNCMTVCGDAGCTAHTFSQVDTCGAGCGDMPPYSSPTPTPSPTEVTGTPTETPTDTATPTVTETPTPIGFCCACKGEDGYCRGNLTESGCLARNGTPGEDCTPIPNQSCEGGNACAAYTPTFTPRPTAVSTNTRTATITPTASQTVTPSLGAFNIDPYNCYRAKGASKGKGKMFDVTDSYGNRTKVILKPYLECAPANVAEDANDTVHNPYEHLTCYKAKDERGGDDPPAVVTVRNFVDQATLELDLKKGQLLCMPSLADFPGAPSPLPSPTPAATGTSTSTPTNTATATNTP